MLVFGSALEQGRQNVTGIGEDGLHQLSLNLHPNEASVLLTVENDALLEAHGW